MKKLHCSRNLLTKEQITMKRLMSLLLTLCLLIPCLTAPALADTPKPIPTIDYDSIPEPREGLQHYLLLC